MSRYRLRRWARGTKSQPLEQAKEAHSVGKRQMRRETGKLLRRRSLAEQHRDAAAVAGAFDVDGGIPDKPYILAGRHAARRECQMDRLGSRLVRRRVPCPDDAAKKIGPAELRDLATQQFAGLVADHSEKHPLVGERPQHRLAAGQRAQAVEVDLPEPAEVDPPRFLPALRRGAEKRRAG